MMHVKADNLWFCVDCTIGAVNGDFSGVEEGERLAQVMAGMDNLDPNTVPDFDSETGEGIKEFLAWTKCSCCGSRHGGGFHRFAVLAEGPAPVDAGTAPLAVQALRAAQSGNPVESKRLYDLAESMDCPAGWDKV